MMGTTLVSRDHTLNSRRALNDKHGRLLSLIDNALRVAIHAGLGSYH